jgi:hypothetical protein
MKSRRLFSIFLALTLVSGALTISGSESAQALPNKVSATQNLTTLDSNNLSLPPNGKRSKYMTKKQAAKHYLSLVCPVNAAYAAWSAVPTYGPEYDAAVQEIIRTSTEAANGFKKPPKKWPTNIKKAWVTWFYDMSVMEAWAMQMYVGANEQTQPGISANFDTYTWEWLMAKSSRSKAYRGYAFEPYWEWQVVYPNLFRKKLGLPPSGQNNGCP